METDIEIIGLIKLNDIGIKKNYKLFQYVRKDR